MKIIKTFFNQYGAIQIQDHGAAFLVSYPDINNAGFTKEKIFNKYIGGTAFIVLYPDITRTGYLKEETFNKHIGSTAWNDAQKFAARKRMEADK